MAIIKEEVITILNELPEDATLAEIQRAIIVKTIPSSIRHVQKVEKQILKFEKINSELIKLIKKADLNSKYLEELIPIERIQSSINNGRNFFIR